MRELAEGRTVMVAGPTRCPSPATSCRTKVMFLHQGAWRGGQSQEDLRPSSQAIQAIHLFHLLMDGLYFQQSVFSTIDVFYQGEIHEQADAGDCRDDGPRFR